MASLVGLGRAARQWESEGKEEGKAPALGRGWTRPRRKRLHDDGEGGFSWGGLRLHQRALHANHRERVWRKRWRLPPGEGG